MNDKSNYASGDIAAYWLYESNAVIISLSPRAALYSL